MSSSKNVNRGNSIALIDKAKFLFFISEASKQSYLGVSANDPICEFVITQGLQKLERRCNYKLKRGDIVITPVAPMPIETEDSNRLITIWAEDLLAEAEDAGNELNSVRTDFAFFLGYYIIATQLTGLDSILSSKERDELINASTVFMQGVLKKMTEKIKDKLL